MYVKANKTSLQKLEVKKRRYQSVTYFQETHKIVLSERIAHKMVFKTLVNLLRKSLETEFLKNSIVDLEVEILKPRRVLKKTIPTDNYAGKSLKRIGVRMRKLFNLINFSLKQSTILNIFNYAYFSMIFVF